MANCPNQKCGKNVSVPLTWAWTVNIDGKHRNVTALTCPACKTILGVVS